MKHPKPKPTHAYADMLTELESYPSLCGDSPSPPKKKIVTKKATVVIQQAPTKNALVAYNDYIRTKRQELLVCYPHLNKAQTLEMAREAYKALK